MSEATGRTGGVERTTARMATGVPLHEDGARGCSAEAPLRAFERRFMPPLAVGGGVVTSGGVGGVADRGDQGLHGGGAGGDRSAFACA